jgi:cytochrome c oxidase subunit 2
MLSKCYVHDLDGYKKWLEEASNWETRMSPVQAGEQFFTQRGCTQCHTVTGARLIGPSLKNVFGEPQQLRNGTTVVADENYLRESLYDPNAKIVAGYEPQMPSYKATLKDKDVGAIIEYLKSISEKHANETINLNAPPTTRPQQ